MEAFVRGSKEKHMKVKMNYIDVYLFKDAIVIYTMDYFGNAYSKQIVPYEKTRKSLKAIKEKIKRIKLLNFKYTITEKNYTDLTKDAFLIL